ncbi:hypothetical protein Tco_0711960 [Tanacetum coccineum]
MAAPLSPDHVSVPLDHALAPPQQDIVMTDATAETTAPKVAASLVRRCRLSSSAAQIHPVTSEPIHHTIPLMLARLARVDVVKLRAEILQLALRDAREEIVNLRTRLSASKSSGRDTITCLLWMEERISTLEQNLPDHKDRIFSFISFGLLYYH